MKPWALCIKHANFFSCLGGGGAPLGGGGVFFFFFSVFFIINGILNLFQK